MTDAARGVDTRRRRAMHPPWRCTFVVAALLVQTIATGLIAMPAQAADDRSAVNADDTASVRSAWRWIRGQLGTGTTVTTPSTITTDRRYPPTWTGAVSGRFDIAGVDPPPTVRDEATGQDVYRGLRVEAVVVTDTAYLIGEAPARADGGFSFPDSRPGAKVFRLTDDESGAVLAEYAPSTGLLRSFEVPAGDPLAGRTYTYDQALALLAALSLERPDTARRLTEGLLRLQLHGGPEAGGFISSAAALNPEAGRPELRTGIHAVATYALLSRLATVGSADPMRSTLVEAAGRAIRWLLDQRVADGPLEGLVTGGRGADVTDAGFDPGVRVTWVSTEHNLDTWHALRLAATVLDDPAAEAAARRLDHALRGVLWDREAGRFLQGWTQGGPDPTEVLDVSSWGSIYLQAAGERNLARVSMRHTALFASADPPVSGFAPRPPSGMPLVWVEGTAGVALAQLRLGRPEAAQETVRALAAAQLPSGAWPVATLDDPFMEMTSHAAVAASAWMVLVQQGRLGRPSIWDDPPSGRDEPPTREGASS